MASFLKFVVTLVLLNLVLLFATETKYRRKSYCRRLESALRAKKCKHNGMIDFRKMAFTFTGPGDKLAEFHVFFRRSRRTNYKLGNKRGRRGEYGFVTIYPPSQMYEDGRPVANNGQFERKGKKIYCSITNVKKYKIPLKRLLASAPSSDKKPGYAMPRVKRDKFMKRIFRQLDDIRSKKNDKPVGSKSDRLPKPGYASPTVERMPYDSKTEKNEKPIGYHKVERKPGYRLPRVISEPYPPKAKIKNDRLPKPAKKEVTESSVPYVMTRFDDAIKSKWEIEDKLMKAKVGKAIAVQKKWFDGSKSITHDDMPMEEFYKLSDPAKIYVIEFLLHKVPGLNFPNNVARAHSVHYGDIDDERYRA